MMQKGALPSFALYDLYRTQFTNNNLRQKLGHA